MTTRVPFPSQLNLHLGTSPVLNTSDSALRLSSSSIKVFPSSIQSLQFHAVLLYQHQHQHQWHFRDGYSDTATIFTTHIVISDVGIDMYHYGRNIGQSSSARPVPGRAQTRCYQQQRATTRCSSENNCTQPISPKLPAGSSFNFFSVISKFEALDALSLPYRQSTGRTTPLQRHVDTATTRGRTQSNYAGIFSPSGDSRGRGVTAPNDYGSICTTSNYYTKSSQAKPYVPERHPIATPVPSHAPIITEALGGICSPYEVHEDNKRDWASPEEGKVRKEKLQRRGIRDIISFFDGCRSTSSL